MKKIPDFILFDDDPVNNTLCQITIKNTLKGAKIKTFTSPTKGFQYISTEYSKNVDNYAILFLDINMRGMTCWEFLEQFERLDESLRAKFKIYILSASISSLDKQRAALNKNISDFIAKPLTGEKILKIVSLN